MADSSTYVSQSGIPSSVVAGDWFKISVTFHNNGTTTWAESGSYRLHTQNPVNNYNWLWGEKRVYLEPTDSIAPGQDKTFDFWCRAPSVLGTYNLQFRMVQESSGAFGAFSSNISITVTTGTVYRIEESSDGISDWKVIAGGLTGSSGSISGLSGVETYLRIWKTIDGIDSDYSDAFYLALSPAPILTATGGLGADHISLSWTNTGAYKYNLYKFDSESASWVLISNLAGTSKNDYSVSQNIFYFYYVTSVDIDGSESEPSNVASARITRGGIFSMALSRASIYQGIQLGMEDPGSPGTLVAATKRLLSIQMNQVPQIPIKVGNLQGSKGNSSVQHGKEYTEAKFSGLLDFNMLTYLFALCYGDKTPVLLNAGYTRTWQPSATDPELPGSATIEEGSVKGAEKFGFATIQDLQIKWSNESADLEGTIFGQNQTRNATMTTQIRMTASAAAMSATSLTVATSVSTGTIPNGTYKTNLGKIFVVSGGNTITASSATLTVGALAVAITAGEVAFLIPELPAMVVSPTDIGIYISTDGTNYTQLLDGIDGQINLNSLWGPSFHVNDQIRSFDRLVERNPNITATITSEEGTEADNFMTSLYNSQKVWLGFKATGLQINASPLVKHLFRLNIPMYVTKPDPGDKNDVYGNTFSFDLAHDGAYGLFLATLTNTLATL